MLPDSILPTPEDDIARVLRDYERRLSHLETLEQQGAHTEGARAYHSVNQSIASGGTVFLSFDSENYDTDNIHDLVINNGRLTGRTAGKYHIFAHCQFNVQAGGRRIWIIRLNGVTRISQAEIGSIADGTAFPVLFASTVYDLAVDDYVEIGVFQNSGFAINIISNAGSGNFDTPVFGMQKIG